MQLRSGQARTKRAEGRVSLDFFGPDLSTTLEFRNDFIMEIYWPRLHWLRSMYTGHKDCQPLNKNVFLLSV